MIFLSNQTQTVILIRHLCQEQLVPAFKCCQSSSSAVSPYATLQQVLCNIRSSLPYVKSSKEVRADWYPKASPTVFLPFSPPLYLLSHCSSAAGFSLDRKELTFRGIWRSIHQGWLWRHPEMQWVNNQFQSFIPFIHFIKIKKKCVKTVKKHNDVVIEMVTHTCL